MAPFHTKLFKLLGDADRAVGCSGTPVPPVIGERRSQSTLNGELTARFRSDAGAKEAARTVSLDGDELVGSDVCAVARVVSLGDGDDPVACLAGDEPEDDANDRDDVLPVNAASDPCATPAGSNFSSLWQRRDGGDGGCDGWSQPARCKPLRGGRGPDSVPAMAWQGVA